METHIRPFDSDSFPWSLTPFDFNFPHKPHRSGIGGGVGFFIRSSYRPHIIESSVYQSLENMVVSIGLHGHSLLLACIYRPPGSCTSNFLEEFMSFVGYLSSINSSYYICGDFSIHVDVPFGDGHKFITFLDLCDLKQSINLLISMVTYWTSFYPPVTRTLLLMSNFATLFLIMHYSNAQLPSLVKWLTLQIEFNIDGTTVSTCLTFTQISKILPSLSLQLMLLLIFTNNMYTILVMFLISMHLSYLY